MIKSSLNIQKDVAELRTEEADCTKVLYRVEQKPVSTASIQATLQSHQSHQSDQCNECNKQGQNQNQNIYCPSTSLQGNLSYGTQ